MGFFFRTQTGYSLSRMWQARSAIRTVHGCKDPEVGHAAEWLEIMKPGDSLSFLRRDGGALQISRPGDEIFSVRCADASSRVVTEAAALDSDTVLNAIKRYLDGDLTAFVKQLRRAVR